MSGFEGKRWGDIRAFLNPTNVRVYYWVKYKMYKAVCTLNRDNSLCVLNEGTELLPPSFWFALDKESDKIITYLMLKGCK